MPKILVYPVPGPFSLGLHLTMEDNNTLKFGPSVDSPFFSLKDFRYNKSLFLNKNLQLLKTYLMSFNFKIYNQLKLEFGNNKYGNGIDRIVKIYKRYNKEDLLKFSEKKSLIRTPAINLTTKSFEHDFIIEHSKNNVHLINFQSPAWTCFLPLSKHILNIFQDSMRENEFKKGRL